MEREVRYCTSADGVRIAYCVEGKGRPLVILPGIESFAKDDVFPENLDFLSRLATHFTLIRNDLRGVGLSQRDPEDVGPEALIDDLTAVVEATGLAPVAVFAYLTSGPAAIQWVARNQNCVSAFVLFETFVSFDRLFSAQLVDSVAGMAANGAMPFVAQSFASDQMRKRYPVQSQAIARAIAESIDGSLYARLFRANQPCDSSPFLREIHVPTLVLNRKDDKFFTPNFGQEIAAGIHGAVFKLIDGESNHYAVENPDTVLEAIVSFLLPGTTLEASTTHAPQADRSAFRTILFTDLVAHTEMMSRLGDERGRAVLREHERITREVLKAHGGTEVKTMGDGFMASFGSVTKAVECAIAIQKAFAERDNPDVGARRPFSRDAAALADPGAAAREPSGERHASPQTPPSTPAASTTSTPPEPLSIRVGLNAGEPIEEDGDLFGATVILAARIAAKAGAGEILVADTVRGLCSGKGFVFADRGEFVAKGFEEPVRVYEVAWRE
jgi:class 3 adenylate cyclase/pimeloyl-ACP methyl ester carboxylesterase